MSEPTNEELKQLQNLETNFLCKLAMLISTEDCNIESPLRATAMVAALSSSAGVLIGAMGAYVGGPDGEQASQHLMRLVASRVSSGANIGDAAGGNRPGRKAK